MDYFKVKDALYRSKAIQDIPDKWEESIPFKCLIRGRKYDSFLYWITTSNQAEIKRMICIDCETGTIKTLGVNEIVDSFGIFTLKFDVIQNFDYDTYFRAKEEYDDFYSSVCGDNVENMDYSKGLALIKIILGDDCIQNVLSVIAKDYINELSSEKL